jgi:hypothetical protein
VPREFKIVLIEGSGVSECPDILGIAVITRIAYAWQILCGSGIGYMPNMSLLSSCLTMITYQFYIGYQNFTRIDIDKGILPVLLLVQQKNCL